jgi:hypothetical protein
VGRIFYVIGNDPFLRHQQNCGLVMKAIIDGVAEHSLVWQWRTVTEAERACLEMWKGLSSAQLHALQSFAFIANKASDSFVQMLIQAWRELYKINWELMESAALSSGILRETADSTLRHCHCCKEK